MIVGYHVIFGVYGFWLPNDPRGSWSEFVASWELARFGKAGIPAGVRDESDLPGLEESWLPALAKRLGVKAIIVHRWRWSG